MKSITKASLLGATALGAGLMGTAAVAQVDVITVTAQKREQTLQEVPVAVTVVTEELLENAQILDIVDLQTAVPSLRVSQNQSPANTSFSIRGLGSDTNNFGLEPSVGIFVDGVYRSRNGAAVNDFLGLERVEVLRGPQSTLFGKNTSAGVISFTTAEPSMEFGAEAVASIGNLDLYRGQAMVEGPILEDMVAARIDVNWQERDGYVDNLAGGPSLNDRDRWGVRGQFLIEPSSRLSVRVIGDHNSIDENCCAAPFAFHPPGNAFILGFLGGTVVPPDPDGGDAVAVDEDVAAKIVNQGISAEVNYEFDGFTLTSITAYREYDERQRIDPDWVDLTMTDLRQLDHEYETTTQEFRITSTGDRTVDWVGGFYYFNQDLSARNTTRYGPDLRPFADLFSDLDGNPATPGSLIDVIEGLCNGPFGPFVPGCVPGSYLAQGQGLPVSFFEQEAESWAVFGQADWHITDRLTLTGGLRYTEEDKELDSAITVNDPFSAVDLVAVSVPILQAFGLTPAQAAALAPVACLPGQTIPTCNPILGLSALQFFPPAPSVSGDFADDDISGTIRLAYDLTPSVNVYASWTTGYKAGGFALDASAARVGDFTFDAETTTSYEIGLKGFFLDDTVQANFALFQQESEDFQTNVFTGSTFVPDNAGSILLQGLEGDITWAPNQRFNVNWGFTYMFEMEYEEFENAQCPVSDPSGCTFITSPLNNALVPVQDLSGKQLAGAARFVSSLGASYTQPVGNNLEVGLYGDFYYTSDRFLDVTLDPLLTQDDVYVFNASVSLGNRDGDWELQAWGRNLTDYDYVYTKFFSTLPGSVNAYPAEPRTYGLTLRMRY